MHAPRLIYLPEHCQPCCYFFVLKRSLILWMHWSNALVRDKHRSNFLTRQKRSWTFFLHQNGKTDALANSDNKGWCSLVVVIWKTWKLPQQQCISKFAARQRAKRNHSRFFLFTSPENEMITWAVYTRSPVRKGPKLLVLPQKQKAIPSTCWSINKQRPGSLLAKPDWKRKDLRFFSEVELRFQKSSIPV